MKEKIGNLELGAISGTGIVEAVAKNFYQVGYQFHPENINYTKEDMIFNRGKNLLFNFLKIIKLARMTDIATFNDALYVQLKESFDHGQCILQKDTCLKPTWNIDVLGIDNSFRNESF